MRHMLSLGRWGPRRTWHRSRGQSLVELALILPILLVLVGATLDLGRVFYATITVANAAREGAMQAARSPDDDAAIVARAQFEAQNSGVTIDAADVSASCSDSGCPRQANSTVTVSVVGTFALLTPMLTPIFGGQTVDFGSTAIAQVEYLPAPGAVTPPPGPMAAFAISPNDIEWTSPQVVDFTDLSSGDPGGWLWTFHDGSQASTKDASFTYTAAGTYEVTLQIVNLTGTDSITQTVNLSPDPSEPPPPPPPPAPSVTPACIFPPNVMGANPTAAGTAITGLGLTPDPRPILTTGQKNVIQAQNPDHTQCVAPGSTVTMDYRLP